MENVEKNKVQKVVIDTDPGIDDAMAIMIALKEHKKGNIDILAITLVYGNSTIDKAQVNVLRVLEVFDLQNQVHIEIYKKCIHSFLLDKPFSFTCPNKYITSCLRFLCLLDQVGVW